MPDNLQPITSGTAPRYRYYTVNIVTNQTIGEIPFEDVNYERSIKTPGAFDGKITINDQTANLDLYNATLPGKTALYVVRDDKAVWGGIIWGRTYDLVSRSLSVTATEFISYLSHRMIWKTYTNSFTAKLIKEVNNAPVQVIIQDRVLRTPIPLTDGQGNFTKVNVNFVDTPLRKYSGSFTVVGRSSTPAASADPGLSMFYIDMPSLPKKDGMYDGVGVTMKVDTYSYLRDIISNTFSDFVGIEFPNDIVEPGVKLPFKVLTKQLTISDSTHGVATLTTEDNHDIVVGQRVEVVNVDKMLDGKYIVTEVQNNTSFSYVLDNPKQRDEITPIYLDSSLSSPVSVYSTRDTVYSRSATEQIEQGIKYVSRKSGVVTLTFNGVHNFTKGQKIILSIAGSTTTKMDVSTTTTKNGKKTTKTASTNTFSYVKFNDTVAVTSATSTTLTYDDPIYKTTKFDKSGNVSPATCTAINAAPLTVMQLFVDSNVTDNVVSSDGYAIGDDIYVRGVDDAGWGFPMYDGYQKVYDVDPGASIVITHASVTKEVATEDNIDVDPGDMTYVARLYCSADPKISNNDRIEISGITTTNYTSINGTYNALDSSYYDSVSARWIVKFEILTGALAKASLAGTPRLGRTGSQWVAYRPNNSEIRNSLQKEPDGISNISSLKYKPASGNRKNTVIIKTIDRHNLLPGDKVRLLFTSTSNDGADQKVYGDTVSVLTTSGLYTFTYTLIGSEHKAAAPKKEVAETSKTGTVTRLIHSLKNTQPLGGNILGVRTVPIDLNSSHVCVYAKNHGLEVGDTVAIDIGTTEFANLSTNGDPVQITKVSTNAFWFNTGAPSTAGESVNITSISYSADKSTITFKAPFFGTYTARTASVGALEFNTPSPGYIQMTTSQNPHNIVVNQKVTFSGFPAASTTVVNSRTINLSLSTFTYNNSAKKVIVKFTTAHGLNLIDDIGTTFTMSGFAEYVNYGSQTSKVGGVYSSWLNGDHTITAIPSATSIQIDHTEAIADWEIYNITTPAVCKIVTKTQTVRNDNDFSALNVTTEVLQVPAANKLVIKYPNLLSTELVGSQSVTGVTVTAAAQKGVTAAQIDVGDYLSISGMINDGTTNKYAMLNRDGYAVQTVSAVSSVTTFTVTNPNKDAKGKYVGYANTATTAKFGGTAAKVFRGYDVTGSYYIDTTGVLDTDVDISNLSRNTAGNVATVTIGAHNFSVGDKVTVFTYARNRDAFQQNNKSLTITGITDTAFTYSLPTSMAIDYVSRSAGGYDHYYFKSGSHSFIPGDAFTVYGSVIPAFNNGGATLAVYSTGPDYIVAKSVSNTAKVPKIKNAVTITVVGRASLDEEASGQVRLLPTIYRQPTVFTRTAGEFPANASLGGISFSRTDYSGTDIVNSPVYGSGLSTVSSILEQYSNGINGFDYRIDVSLDYDSQGQKVFNRVFTVIPIIPPTLTAYLATLPGGVLAPGQVASPSALGADKVVFEYPGSIANVTLSERADSAATRVFVTGNNKNAGTGEESAYSGAANSELLLDGWPLLDKKQTVTWPAASTTATGAAAPKNVDEWGNHDDETDYYISAKRFLLESRPPASEFTIDINGSVPPIIGTYDPGDWCSIIIHDDFVKNRLNSVLEPRKEVLVRRIDTIKVSVPNNPAFPEKISLALVQDWQVDTIGK